VFLDQYGLLPRYDPLVRGGGRGLRDICVEYYDVRPTELESKWIVKRRVDRSKVYSTTTEFRQEWDVELVNEQSSQASHSHSKCKLFNGIAVLGDHRDHNLVTRRAKAELLGLPDVDWTVAPHIVYSRADYDVSADSSSRLPDSDSASPGSNTRSMDSGCDTWASSPIGTRIHSRSIYRSSNWARQQLPASSSCRIGSRSTTSCIS